MKRYVVSLFDKDTFLVVDKIKKKEICICGNYENSNDAEKRAKMIAIVLNNVNK